MTQRQLTCIGCPMGCQLTATIENGVVTTVTGNTCKRGDSYARKECVAPARTVTGTVRCTGGAARWSPSARRARCPRKRSSMWPGH